MDKKKATGERKHMRKVVDTTPTLLFTKQSGRHAVTMYNEGPADVHIGPSGTATSRWMTLANGQGFTDTYSKNSWWGITLSSSGTVSGFKVI
jgi:hypothetical protein